MDIHSITIGNLWMVEIQGIKNVYAHFCIYLRRMGTLSVIKKRKGKSKPSFRECFAGAWLC